MPAAIRRRFAWLWRLRKPLLVFVLAGAAVGVFLLYSYLSFNLWLEKDARALEPYPATLLENGERVAPARGLSPRAKEIENALIRENTASRLVTHLSRSDLRRDWLRGNVHVKVYLETALPGEPDRLRRIKALNTLARRGGQWTVINTRDLTIP